MTVQEKISRIESGIRELPRTDGFTYDEYDVIMRSIEKQEGCFFDIIAIWKYGIDNTYPVLRDRYPYVWGE
jgi:hypothetical protein